MSGGESSFTGANGVEKPTPPTLKPTHYVPVAPSKTAIARIEHSIVSLPTLYLIDITTKCKDKDVLSTRLRQKAVTEFITSHKQLSKYLKCSTLQTTNSGKVRIEQLVISGHGTEPSFLEDVKNAPIPSIQTKMEGRGDEGAQAIHCQISNTTSLDENSPDQATYRKSLARLFLSRSYWDSLPASKQALTVNQGFLIPIAELPTPKDEPQLKREWTQLSNNAKQQLEHTKFPIYTRGRSQFVDKTLRVDFDLLSCIPASPSGTEHQFTLADVLVEFFGISILGSDNSSKLDAIKYMLNGLHVTCDYFHGKKKNDPATSRSPVPARISFLPPSPRKERAIPNLPGNSSDVTSATNALPDGTELRSADNTHGVIRDVRLPGSVDTFWRGGKKYTVTRYFNEEIYKDYKQRLKYNTLPLAEIRPGCWIPLENLVVSDNQELRSKGSHSLRDRLLNLASELKIDMYTPKEQLLKDLSVTCGQLGIKIDTENEWNELTADHSHHVQSNTGDAINQRVGDKGLQSDFPQLNVKKIGVIFVTLNGPTQCVANGSNAENRSSASSQFFNKILENLRGSQGLEEGQIEVVTMPDATPLIDPHRGGMKPLKDWDTSEGKVDLVFAVIDQHRRNSKEVEDIRAEITKYGDRTIGTPTYCITKQSLEKVFRSSSGADNYFPFGILQHLKLITGEGAESMQPFAGLPNEPNDSDRLVMFVGAHVSHPPSGAVKHCPSVASVVANVYNDRPSLYSGASCVQCTPRHPKENSGTSTERRVAKIDEKEIVSLQELMKRHFIRFWSNTKKMPRKVFFYRDGLQAADTQVIKSEFAHIEAAFEAACIGMAPNDDHPKLLLNYICVHKQSADPFRLEGDGKGKAPQISRPDTEFWPFESLKADQVQTHHQNSRESHTYTGYHPSRALLTEELPTLTINLRNVPQISKDRLSVPFPLYCARKLCARTFQYFRFAITNEIDTISEIKRVCLAPENSAYASAQAFRTYILEYLWAKRVTGEALTYREKIFPYAEENLWRSDLNDKMFYL